MKKRIVALALFAVLLGCAHAPVTEKLNLYQGDAKEDIQGLTFDGQEFILPGGEAIPRQDVQSVEWRKRGEAAGPAAAVASEGLTPLTQRLFARGQAMAQQHPGVAGVILVDDGEFELREDGTNAYQYHFAGQVLKEEMKSWAHIALGFQEGRSRAQLLYAHSVSPDGQVETLSPDALEVGSPSESMEFFNPNRKVLSGVIPGVEVGSVVEYAYTFERYNPEDPRLFFPGYYFQGTEPVVFSRVRISVPKDVTFNYVVRHFPPDLPHDPVTESTSRTVSYTWTVEDVPPLDAEPMMPPESDVLPRMEGSVFTSFDEVFAFERQLQAARVMVTPQIEAKVTELTAGASSVDEKLARLYHWVQENTHYISIKGSLGAGWSGHMAQETFENRYGDCTDKAILFASMCKAIGVTSYPIIILTNTAAKAVTEIPTIEGNHAINEVVLDGRSFYLDTTSENYRYPYFRADDHGVVAVNSIRGDMRTIPVPPPQDNSRYSHLEVTLAPNGDVAVATNNRYTGSIEAGIRGFWKRTREDNRKPMMSDYINSISPGALLDDFTLSDLENLGEQVSMTIDYRIPAHAIRARDLMYLRMPTVERDYPEVALEGRRYPLQYMTTEERVLEIDLILPPGFSSKWVPPPLEITSPYLSFRASYEEHDGVIAYRESFQRLAQIVPVEDYPEYRDHLRAIAAFSKQEIFVEKRTRPARAGQEG